jgi:hypothetical protein
MIRHSRCAGGGLTGFEMGEVFKGLLDKASNIIGKAAENPLGLAALSVLVLGVVGVLLFRQAAGKLKLVAFAMITAGLLGLFVFAANSTKIDTPEPKPISPEQTEQIARTRLADAERLYFAGQNDQARAAYGDAFALFKQEGNPLGQASGA